MMDDYDDSDSSLSDVGSGFSTNVLLGYATKQPVDDAFSRLGGEPSWLDSNRLPPAQLARCKNCSSLMALLLQLNGNLPSRFPGHERSLYIFACRKKACRRKDGCVRGFRCTKITKAQPANSKSNNAPISQAKTASKQHQDIGSTLFGAGRSNNSSLSPSAIASESTAPGLHNPFSTSGTSPSPSNPFAAAPGPPSSLAAKPPQHPLAEEISKYSDIDSRDLSNTFAQKARLSSPVAETFPAVQPSQEKPEAWPLSSEFQKPYPSYFLDADYEYLSPTTTNSTLNGQARSGGANTYESFMDTQGSSTQRGEEDAAYESAHDKTFQHFADTVSQNPEQVLRYEFGGAPLLYSRSDQVGKVLGRSALDPFTSTETNAKVSTTQTGERPGFPRCNHCYAERVFELQLAPHAIAELEAQEEAATLLGGGMEWGTVIMAVCGQDCSGLHTADDDDDDNDDAHAAKYMEEWIGVQWEELVDRSARKK